MGVRDAAAMSVTSEEPRVLPFYGHRKSAEYGEFSNFYEHHKPYEFKLPPFAQREGFPHSIECWFSEAAIMAIKAALFNDKETFDKIVRAQRPGQAKALGREVRNFDDCLWQKHLEETAYEVVVQKFRSSPLLATKLLKTGNAIIVEAAPDDRIWGVGLSTSDPRVYDRTQWQGRNVLGFALMKAREALRSSPAAPADAEEAAAPEADSSKKRSRWGSKKEEPKAAPKAATKAAPKAAPKAAAAEPAAAVEPEAVPGKETFDCFAVLDFEATCENNAKMDPQEIIEFPLVLVDATTLERVDEFRTYVRPEWHPELTQFCKDFTGIQQTDVNAAPSWREALPKVQAWWKESLETRSYTRCLLVTCGDWDLRQMLPSQCKLHNEAVPAEFMRWLNVKNLFEKVTGKEKTGMDGMLKALGLPLEGRHHCGLDDCRNIASILKELLRRGGSVQEKMLSKLKPKKAGYPSTPDGEGPPT